METESGIKRKDNESNTTTDEGMIRYGDIERRSDMWSYYTNILMWNSFMFIKCCTKNISIFVFIIFH